MVFRLCSVMTAEALVSNAAGIIFFCLHQPSTSYRNYSLLLRNRWKNAKLWQVPCSALRSRQECGLAKPCALSFAEPCCSLLGLADPPRLWLCGAVFRRTPTLNMHTFDAYTPHVFRPAATSFVNSDFPSKVVEYSHQSPRSSSVFLKKTHHPAHPLDTCSGQTPHCCIRAQKTIGKEHSALKTRDTG